MLVLSGSDSERSYLWHLEKGEYIIGRHVNADFVLKNSTVSKHHVLVEVSGDGKQYFMMDLNSHNGTLLNGERISNRVEIKEGDTITLGQVDLELVSEESAQEISDPSSAIGSDEEIFKHTIQMDASELLKPEPYSDFKQAGVVSSLSLMAKMLTGPYSKEVVLEKSLNLIKEIIEADRLAVLLKSDKHEELELSTAIGPNSDNKDEFNLSTTIINEILNNNTALVIDDLRKDERFAEQKSVLQSDMRTAMAVPLFDEGKVLGILYADSSNPFLKYNSEHLSLLVIFANIIASRLLNYVLQEERENKKIMQRELEYAGKIQMNLLTKEVPEFEGYDLSVFLEQSRTVGGDFYELAMLPDGRLLFIIADVSGKGMGASLLMSNTLASFRILFKNKTFDPVSAASNVSNELAKYSEPGAFVTLFLGLLDNQTHTLHFVNAGHNPPFIITPDAEIKYLEATGIMLGAFEDFEFKSSTIEFNPGDIMFAFTDGLPEAMNKDEMYSDERVEEKAKVWKDKKPEDLINSFRKDVSNFVEDNPMSDDITLFAIKRL